MKELKKLINVKSIITLLMTVALVLMLFFKVDPPKEIMALYCTSYGAIVGFFFSKKQKEEAETEIK